MAPWIESHDEIWEHHKTIKLCSLLGIEDVAAVGHLISIWHFVLRNAWRDANLEAWGEDGIEHAARWRGERGLMVKALREVGFLDGYIVHGWKERAGKLMQNRLYNERKKQCAAKRRNSAAKRRKQIATLPYHTIPNHTIPNPTQPMDIGRIIPPKREWVAAFCKERNNSVDPDQFMAHYERNGWKVGRNPMKSWKAAICGTWEKNNGGFDGNRNQTGRIVGGAAPVPGKYSGIVNH